MQTTCFPSPRSQCFSSLAFLLQTDIYSYLYFRANGPLEKERGEGHPRAPGKGMAATMAEVAAEASVSQGLAYRYFASKEAIFHELVEQSVQSGIARIQRILQMQGTPGERLDFLISMAWEGRRENPEIYQLLYQVLDDEATSSAIRELIGRQGQAYQDVMRQLIVEGQATREVAEGDPDQLVIVVLACLDGLTRLALRGPEQFKGNFPDNRIILRIFKPHSDQK